MSEPNKQTAPEAQDNQPPADPKQTDKVALRASQAGMRFIAQTHIYNGGNWERMQNFIRDSYHDEMLENQPVDGRLQMFQVTQEKVGRWKVKQVVGTHEHRVVVVVETERGEHPYFLVDVVVEEDYPHKITAYSHQPLEPAPSTDDNAPTETEDET
ncbi:MAG: hypothetical protein AAF126_03295 [Chloroflexota bacterium]